MKIATIPGFALVFYVALLGISAKADFISPFSSQDLYACMEAKKSEAPEWVDCLENYCKGHDKCHNDDIQADAYAACTQDHEGPIGDEIDECFAATY